MSFIFANAWLITMNERRAVLEGANVCVEKDRIVAVGTLRDLHRRPPIKPTACFSSEMSAAKIPAP